MKQALLSLGGLLGMLVGGAVLWRLIAPWARALHYGSTNYRFH